MRTQKNVLYLFLFLMVAASCPKAQPVCYSNSASIYARPGSVVQVNGGMTLGGASTLDNQGIITVASKNTPGTFTIDNTSVSQGSGTYRVEQDWINNSSFLESSSMVELYGNTQQFIGGSVMTTFHDLKLTGTGSGANRKKSLQALNSAVDATGSLTLNDRELDTDVNTFYIVNPSVSCVTNNTVPGAEGFVSSLALGTLSRQTNSNSVYLFPTGSSLITTRYRQVEMTPASATPNVYTVRMANNDATVDLCPIANHSASVGNLNPFYYHKIKHISGPDDADVRIYYEGPVDGSFDGMAHWNIPAVNFWNDMVPVTASGNNVFKTGWSDFSQDPFILANEKELPVVVPNVFTPNGDGVNDLFEITDANYDVYSIEIFDRWGMKMFQSTTAATAWDGRTVAGALAVDGTYYFILKAITKKSKTDYSTRGFLMLLRN
jgi:gliding motility-associated-like protein